MYFNNIHILIYIMFGLIGLLIGHFITLANIKLAEHKKVFSNEIIQDLKIIKPNYILMTSNSALFISVLYMIGVENPIKLIGSLVIIPILLSAFYIDFKKQIIPNRLTLTLFEIGLIYSFALAIGNINSGFEMLLGGIIGSGVFLLITFLGGLIYGKESMGFGDVKLIGALGLFFGWRYIIVISILSFLIGALYSIGLIITLKIKKKDKIEYIAFGPFIVIATIIVIFIPLETLIELAFKIFTIGR